MFECHLSTLVTIYNCSKSKKQTPDIFKFARKELKNNETGYDLARSRSDRVHRTQGSKHESPMEIDRGTIVTDNRAVLNRVGATILMYRSMA